MECTVYAAMRVGPRDRQEDCIIDGVDLHQEKRMEDKRALQGPHLLMAVCDGMGGHRAGDAASRFVCEQLKHMDGEMPIEAGSIRQALSRIQQEAEEKLPPDSGTTVAGLFLTDHQALTFNAGDSRVYRIDADGLHYISHDHSLVQEWVDRSLIRADTAFGHPYRHLVEFGIGPAFKDIWDQQKIHVHMESPRRDACYLLCSDGLNDILPDDKIHAILSPAPLQNGKKLLKEITRKGLKDNTSFIIAEIRSRTGNNGAEMAMRRPS